jgi:hypothetical protein
MIMSLLKEEDTREHGLLTILVLVSTVSYLDSRKSFM